ncbi:hypothetical protein [Bacillus wiedmannii]|uniref:hypothetical protein n=1 Tax=Bacillus wiedmannii TaxID=1890302 RepID=UPI000B442B97|nr:hypothetical protein [Bacillus wiedmannii]MED3615469.1 hypothetical protein [Bacillus wiedmannii]OUB85129.1 hypothetical protein BK788_13465 [Bacillus thuringiensis serovar sinensis]
MKLPSAIGLKKNSKGKPVNELQDFLQTFGYLKKSDNETTLGALEAISYRYCICRIKYVMR